MTIPARTQVAIIGAGPAGLLLSHLLHAGGVSSVVLNANNDAEEAKIIAEAGAREAGTVSTQMAGRGTDIRLGGSKDDADAHDEVIELGGLCVVGTGRHDTERLDSQLRGRAGRQGDPGTSVFFSSLEDPVVTKNLAFKRDPVSPNEDGSMGSKGVDLIEQAQRIAEGVMLELHANTWRYNKLVNQQRDIIVERRMQILTTDAALEELADLEPDRYAQLTGSTTTVETTTDEADAEKADAEKADTENAATDHEAAPAVTPVPREVLTQAAREIVLYHLDRAWADHLAFVSDVRASIHLRSLGKESPLDEFHRLILAEFADLPGTALAKARETFREADITPDGVDLGSADLHRSTTTWTYMVHDNLFSSGGAKTLQGIIGIFR